MSANAAWNVGDVTDLARGTYERLGVLSFQEASVLRNAINGMYDVTLPDGSGFHTFTKFGAASVTGTSTASTTVSAASASESQATATLGEYRGYDTISHFANKHGAVDLLTAIVMNWSKWIGVEYDYLCALTAQGSTTSGQYEFLGQSSQDAIAASNTLTHAYVRKAHAKLASASAPTFNFGAGPGYLAVIHPDVAYDLKAESSGIFTGATNVDSIEFKSNRLIYTSGFYWLETANTALKESNVGAGGTVDVYNNLFISDGALGCAKAPVASNPLSRVEINVTGEGFGIVRVLDQVTDLGSAMHCGGVLNAGFARIDEKGIYRIESASSLATNV